MRTRLGQILVSLKEIRRDYESVAQVFGWLKLVPVRAELLYASMSIEYLAISERFREIPEGSPVPRYEIKVRRGEDGGVVGVDVREVEQ